MANTDKTVMKSGEVIYLAGRNYILNSESPVWTIEDADADALADVARADITVLTE